MAFSTLQRHFPAAPLWNLKAHAFAFTSYRVNFSYVQISLVNRETPGFDGLFAEAVVPSLSYVSGNFPPMLISSSVRQIHILVQDAPPKSPVVKLLEVKHAASDEDSSHHILFIDFPVLIKRTCEPSSPHHVMRVPSIKIKEDQRKVKIEMEDSHSTLR